MKPKSWLPIVTATLSLFLAVGYWHQLYEEGDFLRRYAGPLWLVTAVLWTFAAYRWSSDQQGL